MNISLLIANYALFALARLWVASDTNLLDAVVKHCPVVVETYCSKSRCGLDAHCRHHYSISKRIKHLGRVTVWLVVPMLFLLTIRFAPTAVFGFGPTGQRTFTIAAVLLAVQVLFLLADRIQAAVRPTASYQP